MGTKRGRAPCPPPAPAEHQQKDGRGAPRQQRLGPSPSPAQQRGGDRCRGAPVAPLSRRTCAAAPRSLNGSVLKKRSLVAKAAFWVYFIFSPRVGQRRLLTKSECALPPAQRRPVGPGGVTCQPRSAELGAAPPAAAAAAVSDTRGAQPARRAGGGPMSGGGGAAGPRLYGYGGALPPAALLRRDLAAPAAAAAAAGTSRVGGAAVGTAAAGAAPPPFSSALLCAAARVPRLAFLLLLQPRRALRIAQREREGRFDAATPPPLFVFVLFYFILSYYFAHSSLHCSAPGSLPATRTAVPPGKAGALWMRLPGTGGADSWSGFIDSRWLPSSSEQTGLVPVRIANCRER